MTTKRVLLLLGIITFVLGFFDVHFLKMTQMQDLFLGLIFCFSSMFV